MILHSWFCLSCHYNYWQQGTRIVWTHPSSAAEYFAFNRKNVSNPCSCVTSDFPTIRITDNLIYLVFFENPFGYLYTPPYLFSKDLCRGGPSVLDTDASVLMQSKQRHFSVLQFAQHGKEQWLGRGWSHSVIFVGYFTACTRNAYWVYFSSFYWLNHKTIK